MAANDGDGDSDGDGDGDDVPPWGIGNVAESDLTFRSRDLTIYGKAWKVGQAGWWEGGVTEKWG